jgi:BolA protein
MKIQQSVERKINADFTPAYLLVENESHMHSVPANSETHFKLTLVSDEFRNKRKVARHQAVYRTLAQELAGEVHALTMHLYSIDEWAQANEQTPDSPQCLGGSKADS